MKKIYKSLISILIISMLAIVGMAAKPTPGPSGEQIQDQRLTALETNDTNQSVNNTEQQASIDGLKGAINNLGSGLSALITRVTDLENNPYPAIYSSPGKDVLINETQNGVLLNTLSVNLPRPAYVDIQISGYLNNWQTYSEATLQIDNIPYIHIYGQFVQTNVISATGIQVSKTLYLPAGLHTINAYGWVFSKPYPSANGYAEITAVAYDKGTVPSSQINTGSTPQIPVVGN